MSGASDKSLLPSWEKKGPMERSVSAAEWEDEGPRRRFSVLSAAPVTRKPALTRRRGPSSSHFVPLRFTMRAPPSPTRGEGISRWPRNAGEALADGKTI